jgi:hypothetical protein
MSFLFTFSTIHTFLLYDGPKKCHQLMRHYLPAALKALPNRFMVTLQHSSGPFAGRLEYRNRMNQWDTNVIFCGKIGRYIPRGKMSQQD